MPTLGSQVIPAKVLDLRRVMSDLSAGDLGVLDDSLSEWMHRPFGREALASLVFPSAGSPYVCFLNFEPAGLILLERGHIAARIRALAVAPDMRRRGLARTMLEAANDHAREANLAWLWMTLPSDNVPATSCALACSYRRYRPQFLRRQQSHALPIRIERAHVELLRGREATDQLRYWMRVAAEQGDGWCSDVALSDLLTWNMAELDRGALYLLVSGVDEVGIAHLGGASSHRIVTLWLERAVWSTPREAHVLKALLDSAIDIPVVLDVEFGSSGHLRASVATYKAFGFKPVLRERVVMAKKVI